MKAMILFVLCFLSGVPARAFLAPVVEPTTDHEAEIECAPAVEEEMEPATKPVASMTFTSRYYGKRLFEKLPHAVLVGLPSAVKVGEMVTLIFYGQGGVKAGEGERIQGKISGTTETLLQPSYDRELEVRVVANGKTITLKFLSKRVPATEECNAKNLPYDLVSVTRGVNVYKLPLAEPEGGWGHYF